MTSPVLSLRVPLVLLVDLVEQRFPSGLLLLLLVHLSQFLGEHVLRETLDMLLLRVCLGFELLLSSHTRLELLHLLAH